ncbi:MAG: thioredoxin-disulfide reductase [Succinivibrio sp.]
MTFSNIYQCVIIGSGPAGCTAAIYACRFGLKPLMISGTDIGGQLTTSPEIANWPGRSDNPDGFSLMQSLLEHAKAVGTKELNDSVVKVDFSYDIKLLYLSSGTVIKARTVIIATGAKARYLGLESENKYKGRGVSACATCDGFFFKNRIVCVVGGGNTALVEALYLADICSKVYLIHRRDTFRAEAVLVDKAKALFGSRIFPILNSVVTEIVGDSNMVNAIRVRDDEGDKEIATDGVFIAIGHEPSTAVFDGSIEMDEDGTIKTGFGAKTATSASGVFAAGDCADRIYRQAITSAGAGCSAAIDAHNYLGIKK